MLNRRLSESAANASVNAIAEMLNNGYLNIYDGPQPASAADAPTKDNRLLAVLRFKEVAFKPAEGGIAVSHELLPDTDAKATGVAGWYRMFESDYSSVVEDGTVGRKDANMLMNATAIQEHAEISVKSVTLKVKV